MSKACARVTATVESIRVDSKISPRGRTIKATGIRNKPKGVSEIILDKVYTAAHSGDDDHATFLGGARS